jgi:hypothetical protein
MLSSCHQVDTLIRCFLEVLPGAVKGHRGCSHTGESQGKKRHGQRKTSDVASSAIYPGSDGLLKD